jgi:hypothetical protein
MKQITYSGHLLVADEAEDLGRAKGDAAVEPVAVVAAAVAAAPHAGDVAPGRTARARRVGGRGGRRELKSKVGGRY